MAGQPLENLGLLHDEHGDLKHPLESVEHAENGEPPRSDEHANGLAHVFDTTYHQVSGSRVFPIDVASSSAVRGHPSARTDIGSPYLGGINVRPPGAISPHTSPDYAHRYFMTRSGTKCNAYIPAPTPSAFQYPPVSSRRHTHGQGASYGNEQNAPGNLLVLSRQHPPMENAAYARTQLVSRGIYQSPRRSPETNGSIRRNGQFTGIHESQPGPAAYDSHIHAALAQAETPGASTSYAPFIPPDNVREAAANQKEVTKTDTEFHDKRYNGMRQDGQTGMFFHSYEEAMAAFNQPRRLRKTDDPLPTTDEEKFALVRRLIHSILDSSCAKDQVTRQFERRWKDDKFWDLPAVHVLAWAILDVAIKLHKDGWTNPILDPTQLGLPFVDKHLRFYERIDKICILLSNYKSACNALMKFEKLPQIVAGPVKSYNRSGTNNVGNVKKAEQIKVGKSKQLEDQMKASSKRKRIQAVDDPEIESGGESEEQLSRPAKLPRGRMAAKGPEVPQKNAQDHTPRTSGNEAIRSWPTSLDPLLHFDPALSVVESNVAEQPLSSPCIPTVASASVQPPRSSFERLNSGFYKAGRRCGLDEGYGWVEWCWIFRASYFNFWFRVTFAARIRFLNLLG
ncbi:hypothetical protein K432DRAFT_389940 [Lepidopterella palustris CBS 459.81]|uniref:Uncharacterized protein n=1 Tax=Lepidopterella palustris CBS 459.81 TaxID=1314670 RepID=A0A8E2EHB6_9PEZI|nr:hypothetical protein K432DRAFT_389940 [Lepidopterella palustris CBS 459.81]